MLPSCERATSPVSRRAPLGSARVVQPSQTLAHLILDIDVCTTLEQQANNGGVPGGISAVQRGALVVVACTIQLGSGAEQRIHGSRIASVRSLEQIRCHDAAARGSADAAARSPLAQRTPAPEFSVEDAVSERRGGLKRLAESLLFVTPRRGAAPPYRA